MEVLIHADSTLYDMLGDSTALAAGAAVKVGSPRYGAASAALFTRHLAFDVKLRVMIES